MNLDNVYIGFDRDGTLEMPGQPLGPTLVSQINQLNALGGKPFIASGKGYDFLQDNFQNFGLQFWMICAENGGHIVIDNENLNHVVKSHDNHLEYFINNVHTLQLPYSQDEQKHSIWTRRFYDNAEKAANILSNFINQHQLQLSVFSHHDDVGAVDVVPNNIDKTNCLQYIPEDATIYFFGDAENDLNVIKHNRVIPHTIKNAKDDVKKQVELKNGLISEKNAGEGISELLSKIFGV